DLFLDKTLEDMNLEYNDGFSGKLHPVFSTSNYRKSIFQKSPHYENRAELPLFNLFKLHGSVTWKQDDDKIIFDSNLSILNEISSVNVDGKVIQDFNNGNVPKAITELEREVGTKSLVYDTSLKQFNEAYDKLVIINPTKEKFITTTVQYTFYELLRMYSNELEKENSILFVMGFSFADEHIREITKRVANSNPTLLICIFAYNESSKNDIETKLNMQDFKFRNVETLVVGDLASINKLWFSKLANELDEELFSKKKSDLTVNVTIPPTTA
ncbi:MAG: SIR2 family protein, partial [Bacteroidia bacterium]